MRDIVIVKSIGDLVKEYRVDASLSQYQLSKKSGLSAAALSKIESGKIKEPSINALKKIASVLKIPMEFLIPDSYYNTPPPAPPDAPPENLKQQAMRALHRLPEHERLEVANAIIQGFLQHTAQQLKDKQHD
jgi:transcriptional regulator with XRE-family HTH domain